MKKTLDQINVNSGNRTIDLDASWTYSQKSGSLSQDDHEVARGYSGNAEGKNNPAMQDVHNVGPIPQGDWTVTGPPVDTTTHGPYVLKLNPASETQTFGRGCLPDARRFQRTSGNRIAGLHHHAQSSARKSLDQWRQRLESSRRRPTRERQFRKARMMLMPSFASIRVLRGERLLRPSTRWPKRGSVESPKRIDHA